MRQEFQQKLVHWFKANARDLPWRKTSDPYRIWVSEIMLQQTQVATVIPYYTKFLAAFPNVEVLAAADEEEVLRLWQGLGYYRRAKMMREAARMIVKEFGGKFPQSRDELLKIPGIGKYSAGAILSIAHQISTPALDGNLIRVYSRYLAIGDDVANPKTLKKLWGVANEFTPAKREWSRSFAEGMMELGATICTPKNPSCPKCPVAESCLGLKKGMHEILPRKSKAAARIKKREGVLLLKKKGRIAFWPKGSDPKFPDFLRLPFFEISPADKPPPDYDKVLKYSVTVRDFEVFCYSKIDVSESFQKKPIWVSENELRDVLLPAIDRKILSQYSL